MRQGIHTRNRVWSEVGCTTVLSRDCTKYGCDAVQHDRRTEAGSRDKKAGFDGWRVHHQPRAILSLAAAREIKEGPWLCELVQGACDWNL